MGKAFAGSLVTHGVVVALLVSSGFWNLTKNNFGSPNDQQRISWRGHGEDDSDSAAGRSGESAGQRYEIDRSARPPRR